MRVIAGSNRGRSLVAPPGRTTRPITDRVKETLFNILGHHFGMPGSLPGFDVADLFAGSGSLGIEALSRGARSCLFLERDRPALQALRKNLANLGLEFRGRIAAENAWTARLPPAADTGYGLIFIDPPYADSRAVLRVLDLLERTATRIAPDGLVVCRQEATVRLPAEELRGLRLVDEREFGRMRVALLARTQ